MKFKFLVILSIVAFTSQFDVNAQGDAQLSEQYQNMVEGSETFKTYKVVPITKVNDFGKILNDTISTFRQNIIAANKAKKDAEIARDSAKSKMAGLQTELEEAQRAENEMPLLGNTMTKTSYNAIMWGTIVVLIIALVIVYIMFLNSYRLTRQAKKDKEFLDGELEDLRKRSHERQVKIKRELQTALNKLEDHKR